MNFVVAFHLDSVEESPVSLWIFCSLGPTDGFIHVDLVSLSLSNVLILMNRPQKQGWFRQTLSIILYGIEFYFKLPPVLDQMCLVRSKFLKVECFTLDHGLHRSKLDKLIKLGI